MACYKMLDIFLKAACCYLSVSLEEPDRYFWFYSSLLLFPDFIMQLYNCLFPHLFKEEFPVFQTVCWAAGGNMTQAETSQHYCFSSHWSWSHILLLIDFCFILKLKQGQTDLSRPVHQQFFQRSTTGLPTLKNKLINKSLISCWDMFWFSSMWAYKTVSEISVWTSGEHFAGLLPVSVMLGRPRMIQIKLCLVVCSEILVACCDKDGECLNVCGDLVEYGLVAA